MCDDDVFVLEQRLENRANARFERCRLAADQRLVAIVLDLHRVGLVLRPRVLDVLDLDAQPELVRHVGDGLGDFDDADRPRDLIVDGVVRGPLARVGERESRQSLDGVLERDEGLRCSPRP